MLDNAPEMTSINYMCGRFAQTISLKDIIRAFFIEDVLGDPAGNRRYNIAPGQEVVAVTAPERRRLLTEFKWGLVPAWAKDRSIGNRMINARAETVLEKPGFRGAFKSRRCLIPASGFYEWKKESKNRIPYFIRLKSQEPMAFAGLYEHWKAGDQELHTCTILTTEPNELLASVHNRMPVILPGDVHDRWLDSTVDIPEIKKIIVPFESDKLEVYRVSTLVNSPSNDSPDCIVPAGGE